MTITARGFWIRRYDQANHTEVLVNTTNNTFSATIPGLRAGAEYHVRAIARTSGTQGSHQSLQHSFTTPANVPGAPRNLNATRVSNSQIALSWLAPLESGGTSITRYEVQLNNGAWITASSMAGHTFTVTSGTHTLRVRAVNSAGAGAQANISAAASFTVTFNPNPVGPTGDMMVGVYFDILTDATFNDTLEIDYDAYVLEYFTLNDGEFIDFAPLMSNPVTITVSAGSAIGNANIPNAFDSDPAFSGWFNADIRITGSTIVDRNIIAVPRWLAVIIFDSQGGSAVANRYLIPRVQPIGTLPIPIRFGYRFEGWFRIPNGISQVHPEHTFTSGGAILYAVWTPIMHKITFNSHGGGIFDPIILRQGELIGVLPTPARPGYRFEGWFVNQSGVGNAVHPKESFNTSVTLHAVWTLIDPFFQFYGELGWRYPLNHPDSRHISSGYKLEGRPDHEGIDIQRIEPNRPDGVYGAIMGERVYSMHSGTVLIAQWSDTAGFWVAIRSSTIDPARNEFLVSRYLHMGDVQVSQGPIDQGVHIGHVSNLGRTTGRGPGGRSSGHLHIDINNNNRWTSSGDVRPYTINPQRFFPQINFEGLLSTITP